MELVVMEGFLGRVESKSVKEFVECCRALE